MMQNRSRGSPRRFFIPANMFSSTQKKISAELPRLQVFGSEVANDGRDLAKVRNHCVPYTELCSRNT
jgi:hypothetical protein